MKIASVKTSDEKKCPKLLTPFSTYFGGPESDDGILLVARAIDEYTYVPTTCLRCTRA